MSFCILWFSSEHRDFSVLTGDDAGFGMWPSADKARFSWFCPPTVESMSV